MTRSRAKKSESFVKIRGLEIPYVLTLVLAVPTEWSSVPFPVRALKILVNELQNSGEDAMAVAEAKKHAKDEVDADLDVDGEGDDVGFSLSLSRIILN